MKDFRVGDTVYLEEPVRGYRCVEIVELSYPQILVRADSGWEFYVYEDEIED